jgi:hypothetical protein
MPTGMRAHPPPGPPRRCAAGGRHAHVVTVTVTQKDIYMDNQHETWCVDKGSGEL